MAANQPVVPCMPWRMVEAYGGLAARGEPDAPATGPAAAWQDLWRALGEIDGDPGHRLAVVQASVLALDAWTNLHAPAAAGAVPARDLRRFCRWLQRAAAARVIEQRWGVAPPPAWRAPRVLARIAARLSGTNPAWPGQTGADSQCQLAAVARTRLQERLRCYESVQAPVETLGLRALEKRLRQLRWLEAAGAYAVGAGGGMVASPRVRALERLVETVHVQKGLKRQRAPARIRRRVRRAKLRQVAQVRRLLMEGVLKRENSSTPGLQGGSPA